MLNQGCPNWGWNAKRQATHCVAPHRKASTTALTTRTWPQRILVAFMATKDQEAAGDSPQVGNAGEREAGGFGVQIGQVRSSYPQTFASKLGAGSFPDDPEVSIGFGLFLRDLSLEGWSSQIEVSWRYHRGRHAA